jgi:glutamate synthase (NADPH/NADH) large chain
LFQIVRRHQELTGSMLADRLLFDWAYTVDCFRKIMPRDYKRVLTVMREAEEHGFSDQEALGRVMVAAHG